MAGPTFGFWYADFTAEMWGQLEVTLREQAASYRRLPVLARGAGLRKRIHAAELTVGASGLIGVSLYRCHEMFAAYERRAFQQELGFVPAFEVEGYAGAKQPEDYQGLKFVAHQLATRFGGWVVLPSSNRGIPSLPPRASLLDEGVHEVIARDEVGYFGTNPPDEAFVKQYAAFVPTIRYWVIDARIDPSFWVHK
jgi:hypothetical protein